MTREDMLRLRLEEGWSDAAIAAEAGVSRQWVHQRLRPRAPRPVMTTLRLPRLTYLQLQTLAELQGKPVLEVLFAVVHEALLVERERQAVEAMREAKGVPMVHLRPIQEPRRPQS